LKCFAQRDNLQLATAKLPAATSVPAFATAMYNWAATLTASGANYPFALPLQVDRLPTGFKISMLKAVTKGQFGSAADIEATVEEVAGEGSVLFVRFYAGPAADADRKAGAAPADPTARLEALISGLVDVDTIMQTMPRAIRKAVQIASTA